MTGEQADTQRETAPLRRDNSRIQPDRAPVDPGPGQSTRPVFPPPPRPAQQPTNPPTQQANPPVHPQTNPPVKQPTNPPVHPQTNPPGYQQANQLPPQPVNPPVRPTTNPGTSRQPMPEPPPPSSRSKITPMGWALRGAGLLAISLVSGLIWLAVKPDAPEPEETPPLATKYDFQPIRREEGFLGCQNVSDYKIQEFFKNEECEHLTRALYNTTLPDGTRVLTSVVTVQMRSADSAQRLNDLTAEENTGNIRDLVDDGIQNTQDLPKLADKAYASERQDNLVVIGDSAYYDKKTTNKDPSLLDVSKEALKLGWPQDKG
ncbi:hypothetical protein SAMN02982929_02886 [Saccharopolyspora kobensis]|uniref:Uncharacterized protein n=1 Tax=Saccharopolyspora kobensis TaxID=146035 RepID=A0A1H6BVG7_9PSEU|nr:hypothetical protein [Saccharopolyspora kobensis]SEG64622.1 hypothetical protein SAMN02982929_02886 [Saccharopolyspora kobensis]SFC17762.1 hypothetical protein SAMN05216506_101125 [Saccharopolyspora kobensis]